jgi:hypothetical protein
MVDRTPLPPELQKCPEYFAVFRFLTTHQPTGLGAISASSNDSVEAFYRSSPDQTELTITQSVSAVFVLGESRARSQGHA